MYYYHHFTDENTKPRDDYWLVIKWQEWVSKLKMVLWVKFCLPPVFINKGLLELKSYVLSLATFLL